MIARNVVCPYCTNKFMLFSDDVVRLISSNRMLYYDKCPKCGNEIGVIEGEQTGCLIIGDKIIIDNQNECIDRELKVT